MSERDKPVTLRALAAYWRMSLEELADAQISVGVRDGHLNFDSYRPDMSYPNAALHHGGPDGKELHLRFDAMLSANRLVKERTK